MCSTCFNIVQHIISRCSTDSSTCCLLLRSLFQSLQSVQLCCSRCEAFLISVASQSRNCAATKMHSDQCPVQHFCVIHSLVALCRFPVDAWPTPEFHTCPPWRTATAERCDSCWIRSSTKISMTFPWKQKIAIHSSGLVPPFVDWYPWKIILLFFFQIPALMVGLSLYTLW